jgi:site-specific DNA recombinase
MSSSETTDAGALRAVIYMRVSDTRGREDSLISFDVQEKLCRQLCEQRGWEVVEAIRDPDRKGSTLERPGLNQARAALKDGHADIIVVWRLDRFARTMVRALLALQEIVDEGGQVASHAEQLLDTSTAIGRGIAALLFAIAEEELDKIRANWRHAAEHAVSKGWYMGGARGAPLGYAKEPRQPLTPHPTEADAIRGLFARAATGESYERLRRWLRTTHDIEVTSPSLARLLKNRVYLGEMHWGSSPGSNKPSRPRAHAPLVNLHAHEPLVDEITWRRAQRNGRKFGLGREKENPRLLSGLARCAGCRSTLKVHRPKDRAQYYGCRNASAHRERCAGPASMNAERLESYIEDQFIAWLAEQDLRARDDEGHRELRHADAQIAALDAQIADYSRLEVQAALGERWLPGLVEREQQRARVTRRRQTILTELDVPTALAGISEPEDYFGLPLERKRLALAAVFDIVFVRATKRRGPAANTAVTDAERVKMIFRPDGERIALPRPGVLTDWRPFLFGDEAEMAAGVPVG